MAFFVTKNSIRQNSVDCDVIGCDVTTIKFVTFVTGNVENINRYKKWRPLWLKNTIRQNDVYFDVTGCDVTARNLDLSRHILLLQAQSVCRKAEK